jgi:hypothetical protein
MIYDTTQHTVAAGTYQPDFLRAVAVDLFANLGVAQKGFEELTDFG